MLAAGLWSRVRDAPQHRQRRERKAHFGELVQLDGSFEASLEDRGPTACLMHMVDDATSRSAGRFEPQETIWGAVRTLRGWIAAYGIPLALYTDWKNVYVRKPTEAELATGEAPLTQFGRMCATLGIRIIAARSPQAKGRVERGHGTHQDRLIKKLRRKGIRDYTAANTFLASAYLAGHNARFAQPPAAPEDFHTPVPVGLDLDQVFRLETARTVGHDWVVRHDTRLLQLERRGRQYPPARSTVLVCGTKRGAWTSGIAGRASRGRTSPGRPRGSRVRSRRRHAHPRAAHRAPTGAVAHAPVAPALPRAARRRLARREYPGASRGVVGPTGRLRGSPPPGGARSAPRRSTRVKGTFLSSEGGDISNER